MRRQQAPGTYLNLGHAHAACGSHEKAVFALPSEMTLGS
jgi:hypothetical protein